MPRIVSPLLLLAGCMQADEWQRLAEAPYLRVHAEERGQASLAVFRVVDEHGEPIPQAIAYATEELEHPVGGVFWHTAKARADADGFVRLPYPEGSDLLVVMAPGYATQADTSIDSFDVVTMWRGSDVPIRLVDWMGRPVAGAEVGFTWYCGHRPDVQVATSGADGIAWLRGVESDGQEVYVRAPGLAADEYDNLRWSPGKPPMTFRLRQAPDLRGRLVDDRGEPVRGAAIGGNSLHRGPWTWTDEEGRFSLRGLPPTEGLRVVRQGFRTTETRLPRHHALELRLSECRQLMESSIEGIVRLRVLHARDRTPVRERDLVLNGDCVQTDAEGLVELTLAAGANGVVCGDGLCAYESDEILVRVIGRDRVDAELLVRERPTIRLRIAGGPLERGPVDEPQLLLVGPTWESPLDDRIGQPIPVPCDGQAAIWTNGRCFPLPPDFATRTEPVVVPYEARKPVTGRLVDPNGHGIRGQIQTDARKVATEVDGAFRIEVRAGDRFWCSDEAGDLCERELVVLDAHVSSGSLGTIRLHEPSWFTLMDSTGEQLGSGGWLVRDGVNLRELSIWSDGYVEDADPRSGDELWLTPNNMDSYLIGYAPIRTRLTGAGPWSAQLPAGRIDLRVVDEAGAPVPWFRVYYRNRCWDAEQQFELRGLPAGTHRLFIAAESRRTCIAQLGLRDGEQRTLRITLPHR